MPHLPSSLRLPSRQVLETMMAQVIQEGSVSVVEYAANRGVSRRTVIDWIKRGYVQAHRRGYGPTSPWIITGEQKANGDGSVPSQPQRRPGLPPLVAEPTYTPIEDIYPRDTQAPDDINQAQEARMDEQPIEIFPDEDDPAEQGQIREWLKAKRATENWET